MPLHDLERELARDGFLLARVRSSHRHYRNARGQRLTVSVHGGEHSHLNWRQLAQIRKDLERLAAP